MSFFDFIGNVDRRYIYVLLILVVLVPLLNPLGLPIGNSPETQAVYDAVDKLPPNSLVILSPDFSPGAEAELWPQTLAATHHLMQEGHRVIALSLWADGVMYAARAMDTVAPEYDYEYGVDYCVLPWKAGRAAALAAMGRDFRSVYTHDFFDTPTSDLEIFADIEDINSIDLIFSFATGDDQDYYMQQIEAVYGVPITGGCTAVSTPGRMPYIQSGQLQGILSGLKGAAEYEKLVNRPGLAIAGMDAQSLAHALVILFVLLGNVAFFVGRSRQGTGGGR